MSGKIEISLELAEEILKILQLDNWQQAQMLAEAIAARGAVTPFVEGCDPGCVQAQDARFGKSKCCRARLEKQT